jgi:hypothetical protein
LPHSAAPEEIDDLEAFLNKQIPALDTKVGDADAGKGKQAAESL